MFTLIPLGNKVVVRRDENKKQTESGIIIPERVLAKEIPRKGTVISVGPEVGLPKALFPNQQPMGPLMTTKPNRLKEGDRVLFNAFAGSDVEVGDEKFTIMLEDDILAIVVETPDKDEFQLAAEEVGKKKKGKS